MTMTTIKIKSKDATPLRNYKDKQGRRFVFVRGTYNDKQGEWESEYRQVTVGRSIRDN